MGGCEWEELADVSVTFHASTVDGAILDDCVPPVRRQRYCGILNSGCRAHTTRQNAHIRINLSLVHGNAVFK